MVSLSEIVEPSHARLGGFRFIAGQRPAYVQEEKARKAKATKRKASGEPPKSAKPAKSAKSADGTAKPAKSTKKSAT